MNDRITNEKQNVELVCQERLKENAEQVFSYSKSKEEEFSSIFRSDKWERNVQNMN